MKKPISFSIAVPHPFRFRLMILSHGWCDLAPFVWNEKSRSLDTVFSVGESAIALRITSGKDLQKGQTLRVVQRGGKPLTPEMKRDVKERIRWMFRLREDFGPFHRMCGENAVLPWVEDGGLGPFLRNPGLFEEFVKILFTTNVNWGGTKWMTRLLLRACGTPVKPWHGEGDAPIAFPPAEVVAGMSEKRLRSDVRVGYRAPYLLELAEGVASGRTNLIQFTDPAWETEDLARAIRSLKGFGPYAVNSALLTLGRYDRLILDSWIRKTVAAVHFRSKKTSDKRIEKHYARFGEWKVLACWFDCAWESWMRDSFDEDGTVNA